MSSTAPSSNLFEIFSCNPLASNKFFSTGDPSAAADHSDSRPDQGGRPSRASGGDSDDGSPRPGEEKSSEVKSTEDQTTHERIWNRRDETGRLSSDDRYRRSRGSSALDPPSGSSRGGASESNQQDERPRSSHATDFEDPRRIDQLVVVDRHMMGFPSNYHIRADESLKTLQENLFPGIFDRHRRFPPSMRALTGPVSQGGPKKESTIDWLKRKMIPYETIWKTQWRAYTFIVGRKRFMSWPDYRDREERKLIEDRERRYGHAAGFATSLRERRALRQRRDQPSSSREQQQHGYGAADRGGRGRSRESQRFHPYESPRRDVNSVSDDGFARSKAVRDAYINPGAPGAFDTIHEYDRRQQGIKQRENRQRAEADAAAAEAVRRTGGGSDDKLFSKRMDGSFNFIGGTFYPPPAEGLGERPGFMRGSGVAPTGSGGSASSRGIGGNAPYTTSSGAGFGGLGSLSGGRSGPSSSSTARFNFGTIGASSGSSSRGFGAPARSGGGGVSSNYDSRPPFSLAEPSRRRTAAAESGGLSWS